MEAKQLTLWSGKVKNKTTQHERILKTLDLGGWVECSRLVYDSRCLQYTARIKELRDMGYKIENRVEIVNGEKHGFYRLVK